MKGLLTLASALLALGAQAAFAQTGGEVTGRVLDTDTTNNELRISVLESDDGRRVGQTETYYVPPDVDIVIDDYPDRSIAAVEAGADPDLGDLVPGQEVIITFEEGAQGRQATGIRSGGEDQQQAAQTEEPAPAQTEEPAGETYEDTFAADTQERDRLPGSASPLPLIALAGAGFAIVAGWLRHRRR